MEVAAERAAAAAATKLQRSKRARLEVWRRACCRAAAADDVTSEGRCGGPPVVTPAKLLITRGGIYDDNEGTSVGTLSMRGMHYMPRSAALTCIHPPVALARKGDSGPTKKLLRA